MELKPLIIGDIEAKIPIIQGGMGVGISLSSLAGAVAKEGGIGIISAAQPGFKDPEFSKDPFKANIKALAWHIRKAKEIAGPNGIIGVNIMKASKKYDEYVKCCVDNGADLIISGAGLPIELPVLLNGTNVKYAPIVSSLKAAKVLFKMWDRRYKTVSDFIVIEGPKAGGHLGFSPEALADEETFLNYDNEVRAIIEYVRSFEEKYERKIPIVFAGGVYDRSDIDHYISLGCDGVQIATRFVATEECDAAIEYKMAYINSTKDDIILVNSPVGMPGRAIRNKFITLRENEKENITKCFNCLEHCSPTTAPYCISLALIRAAEGKIDDSLVFCGTNAYRLDKIRTVHEIFQELTAEIKD